jgi:hypothetical protein
MTQQHPITPPSELINAWETSILNELDNLDLNAVNRVLVIAWQNGFQTGANAELEACCEWMADETPTNYINALRAARRPKPPSLKKQALARTDAILNDPNRALLAEVRETLEMNRRALEQLKDD